MHVFNVFRFVTCVHTVPVPVRTVRDNAVFHANWNSQCLAKPFPTGAQIYPAAAGRVRGGARRLRGEASQPPHLRRYLTSAPSTIPAGPPLPPSWGRPDSLPMHSNTQQPNGTRSVVPWQPPTLGQTTAKYSPRPVIAPCSDRSPSKFCTMHRAPLYSTSVPGSKPPMGFSTVTALPLFSTRFSGLTPSGFAPACRHQVATVSQKHSNEPLKMAGNSLNRIERHR